VKRKAKEIFNAYDSEEEESGPKRRKTTSKDLITKARKQLKGRNIRAIQSSSPGGKANRRQASIITLDSRTSPMKKKKRHSTSASMTVSQFNSSKAKKNRHSLPAKKSMMQMVWESWQLPEKTKKRKDAGAIEFPYGSQSSSLSKLSKNRPSTDKDNAVSNKSNSNQRQSQLQFTSWGKFVYAEPEPTVEDEMRKIAEGKGNVTIPKRTSSLNASKAIERVVNQDKRPSTSRSMKGFVKGAKMALQGEKALHKTIRLVSGAE
jgi:hypothetical protein